MTLRVLPVACLRDNYAYLVGMADSHTVVVIDPSEAEPVQRALAEHGLSLAAILNTHHHWDHVGGNEALLAANPSLPVFAHRSDHEKQRVTGQTHDVDHEKTFEVAGLSVHPLHVPGHTTGAVAYCIEDAVFTGDTLFVAGCGRLFEGTPAMMHDSLNARLAALPGDTKVYCGHEYTTSNLRFAATVEPDNTRVQDKLRWAEAQGEAGTPTVPSTMAEELATNPFMRVSVGSVSSRYGDPADPVSVLAAVREAKNNF
jgi:hydroxyacylglutathione hydrolase